MKLRELLQGIDILETNASPELDVTGVSYDSRKTQPGELFVAVTGYETDGHKYIPAAMAHGAVAVLCERDVPQDVPYIRVASSLRALARMGVNRYGNPSASMTVVGVTGTNGKTSVTCLLKALLERAAGAKVGLIGTIENRIGDEILPTERTTPESYELQGLLAKMRDAGCKYVVMEVSSHALELHRVDGIDFAVGAFTNLTEDHLDVHKTMENYLLAKRRLFGLCRRGVFNADDPAAPRMIEGAACSVYTVGTAGTADLLAQNIELGTDHVSMTLHEGESTEELRLNIPGRFTVSNALIVIGIARSLGFTLADAVGGLSGAGGVKGRVEVVPTPGKDYTVLIDYAHTPDALENVLRSVRDFCRGRILLVFGCGGDRDRLKRPIMGKIAVENADFVIVTSDNPRTEKPMSIIDDILAGIKESKTPFVVEENRRRAIRVALRCARKHDIIILAGKGHETYQILGTEKTHLDEREEVAAALREGF